MRRLACAIPGLLCLFTLYTVPTREVSAQAGGAALRVGMPQTFFHDLPPVLIKFATEPFSVVLRDTTGLGGELVIAGDAFVTARELCDGKLQLGVFHSFEFGWVQQKHPELRPLMVAINSQRAVSAHVLVRQDSSYASFADLKGKEISLPKRTREHCRVYIQRQCHVDGGCATKEFFSHIEPSANVETGLDDLCKDKFAAAVVDSLGLEFYKSLKPGCFARLKVLAEAEFPPAVIAYRPGGLDEATIDRLRDGMCGAHKTELGREMMKLWKITSFDPVPANYAEAVAECIKLYPPPAASR
jgi:ABC-type phosphate/phosphonate transport system substrate-binding protein